MKISYNWLRQFLDIEQSPQQLSLILTNLGLEVETLEPVQAVPGGLEGLVIGEVKTCIQHPNADRLRVTIVNVGGETDLQIVCGAPNVAAGQKVVVATVGCTVYPTTGEPFKINKSKIRGEVSEGMICAEDEIGLGESHAGIMVLPEDASVGTEAKAYFNLNDDFVYEIGLTPNRADAASHYGVARDLSAFLQIPLKFPDISAFAEGQDRNIRVVVADHERAPRYAGLTISGLSVAESPEWLRKRLLAIGLRPINNVVDATNYVLHELGQPLHAFDAAKISGDTVEVKTVAENTAFTTLDGVERKLADTDLMICDGEKPMCIAGVFGGAHSGVSETTTSIFLESAWFNPVSVRKTARRHGLHTDASFRFERGTDPDMVIPGLKRAALLICEIAGGRITSAITDIYPSPAQPFPVSVTFRNIQRLIGTEISKAEIRSILTGLGISIKNEGENGMELEVPAYKVDVTREVDVIEEILRVYGYDRIAIPSKVNASLNYAPKPDPDALRRQVSDQLSAGGFFEIMANSLTASRYAESEAEVVGIVNPLSAELGIMRQTMLFGGLEAIAYNQNRRTLNVRMYEFGKTYHKKDGKYQERQHLTLLVSGAKNSESWSAKSRNFDFYYLKSAVDALLKKLNIAVDYTDLDDDLFAYGLAGTRNGKILVKTGRVGDAPAKKAGVEREVFYAEFDWTALLKAYAKNTISYREVPKTPAVKRDLSMLIDTHVSFGQLKSIAEKYERKLLREVSVFDVYTGDKLPQGKKSYALSFVLQDEEKTLNDKQIDQVMQRIMLGLEKEAGAEIRK
ncbi:MAG: phenylalanine--tRNA ligase subunit beta [Mucilaginibacter polytrichastri]|nr:phenylalanine--tRNA ligase subunit beta [Mucilaginibacter polytrichastri]